MPVQRVGGAGAVQSGVGNALRRWDGLAGLPRVFHAAGAMHRPSGGGLEPREQPPGLFGVGPDSSTAGIRRPVDSRLK